MAGNESLDPTSPQASAAFQAEAGQTPLVSIIIPAFNAEPYIAETIASALAQTYPNIELIIINDGSTDGTPKIIEDFAARHPRIRAVSQLNAGLSATRNRGIALANGEFVTFLDADDLIRPQKIELQVRRFLKSGPEVGIVYCWTQRIDEDGRIIPHANTCCIIEGACLDEVVTNNIVGPGSVAMLRRRVALEVGGFDETMRQGCEDNKFYARIAENYHFAVEREYLVGYRRVGSSVTRNIKRVASAAEQLIAEYKRRYPSVARWRFRRAFTVIVFWLISDSAAPDVLTEYGDVLLRALRADPLFMTDQWFLSWLTVKLAALARTALFIRKAKPEPPLQPHFLTGQRTSRTRS